MADVPLSLESIRQRLKTRTIGSHLVFHDEVDSTNRAAMALAEAENGTWHCRSG